MSSSGPEARLVKKMRDAGTAKYGKSLVIIKHHGSQYAEAGVSDLLCCMGGNFVAVEVKAPESYSGDNEKARAGTTLKQRAFLNRIIEAGGFAAVCTSVEEFLETLQKVEDSWF